MSMLYSKASFYRKFCVETDHSEARQTLVGETVCVRKARGDAWAAGTLRSDSRSVVECYTLFESHCRLRIPSAQVVPVIAPVRSCRGVAQPGRAPGSGPGGRRFKSSLPDQFFQALEAPFWISVYSAVVDFVDGEIPR